MHFERSSSERINPKLGSLQWRVNAYLVSISASANWLQFTNLIRRQLYRFRWTVFTSAEAAAGHSNRNPSQRPFQVWRKRWAIFVALIARNLMRNARRLSSAMMQSANHTSANINERRWKRMQFMSIKIRECSGFFLAANRWPSTPPRIVHSMDNHPRLAERDRERCRERERVMRDAKALISASSLARFNKMRWIIAVKPNIIFYWSPRAPEKKKS